MVPRSQMMSIRSTQTPKEFLPAIIEAAHSRYPVVGESLDDVMGVLLAKDLLPLILHNDERPFDIKELLRPATFVPESKRLNVLLREFRANRNHMAIVIDEYGGVAGLVTIEDVLEQIVGDIEDEHDVEEDSYIKPLPSGDFIVKALTPCGRLQRLRLGILRRGIRYRGRPGDERPATCPSATKWSSWASVSAYSTPTAAASICCACLPCRTERAPPPRRRGIFPRVFWRLASPSFTLRLAPDSLSPRRCRPAAEGGPGLRSRTLNRLWDIRCVGFLVPAGPDTCWHSPQARSHPGPGALRLLAAGDPLDRPALSRLARPSGKSALARLVVRFRAFGAGTSWIVSVHDYGAASVPLASFLMLGFTAGVAFFFALPAWLWRAACAATTRRWATPWRSPPCGWHWSVPQLVPYRFPLALRRL